MADNVLIIFQQNCTLKIVCGNEQNVLNAFLYWKPLDQAHAPISAQSIENNRWLFHLLTYILLSLKWRSVSDLFTGKKKEFLFFFLFFAYRFIVFMLFWFLYAQLTTEQQLVKLNRKFEKDSIVMIDLLDASSLLYSDLLHNEIYILEQLV